MRFGAAGLSPLRDRAAMQPAVPTALRVGPAPMVVADKSSTKVVAGGQTHTSFWRAEQARAFDPARNVSAIHVAELAELA